MTHLVLIGGGHSHVLVLNQLAGRLPAHVTVTLISAQPYSPYSGMLPGVLAGHYQPEEIFIDLDALCQRTGARFIHDSVCGIDLPHQTLRTLSGQEIHWDWLAIDVGITPDLSVPGSAAHALAVKPIDSFLQRLDLKQPGQITTVGGGAGGVEVALALAHRFKQSPIQHRLVAGTQLLPEHPPAVRDIITARLKKSAVTLFSGAKVTQVEAGQLHLDNFQRLDTDSTLWCTNAKAPDWLAKTGLACDKQGYLKVTHTLQSISHGRVFASGDCATVNRDPRPKAGVFAVRQGPVLANNLLAALAGKPLMRWRPQQRFLSILATGPKHAVASWGPFAIQGRWVWYWKRFLDRQFMRRFPRISGSGSTSISPGDAQIKADELPETPARAHQSSARPGG